jgi:hypothetical protein
VRKKQAEKINAKREEEEEAWESENYGGEGDKSMSLIIIFIKSSLVQSKLKLK